MPAAIGTRDHPHTWYSNVGLRKLPFSELEYYARAPTKTEFSKRNGIFNTVWLPVNASNRVVVDKQQDLMHMKYSLDNATKLANADKDCNFRINNQLTRQPQGIRRLGLSRPLSINDQTQIQETGGYPHSSQRGSRIQDNFPISYELTKKPLPTIELELKPADVPEHVKIAMWKTGHNSLAPFASLGKPTCGYFFTRTVSHKKRLIGINATNTVKWRSNVDILNIKNKFEKAVKS